MKHSDREWEFHFLKLRVCVSIFFLRRVQEVDSVSARRRPRERPGTADKSNNAAIFVVYAAEIEFVLQSRSPVMSRRVTSSCRRRCFNLCIFRRTPGSPVLPADPEKGCGGANKVSRAIMEPLYLTRTATFSSGGVRCKMYSL